MLEVESILCLLGEGGMGEGQGGKEVGGGGGGKGRGGQGRRGGSLCQLCVKGEYVH